MLKLGAADLVNTPFYLVIDSDTVFLRRVPFFSEDGRPLYATGTEYLGRYFETFQRLLGFSPLREYSFITHHMIFSVEIVKEMRDAFTGINTWETNLLSGIFGNSLEGGGCFSEGPTCYFSEYETYGHYLKARHPRGFRIRPLKWHNVPIPPSRYLLGRLSKLFDFCSFHEWALQRCTSETWPKYHLCVEKWLLVNRLRLKSRIRSFLGVQPGEPFLRHVLGLTSQSDRSKKVHFF